MQANLFLLKSLKKIFKSREIISFFILRDVAIRYKYPLTGIIWVVVQPLLMVFILSTVFGRVAHVFSEVTPYPIFVAIGVLFWSYFSTFLTKASNSLIAQQSFINMVYFPRLIIPLSALVVGLIDFFLSMLVLIMLMSFYQLFPSFFGFAMLVVGFIITFFTTLGLSLIFCVLLAKYHDTRQILPFFITIFFFVTPVMYPIRILPPPHLQWISFLNPLVGVIETIRATILHHGVNWEGFLISLISSFVILYLGLLFFVKHEQELADII